MISKRMPQNRVFGRTSTLLKNEGPRRICEPSHIRKLLLNSTTVSFDYSGSVMVTWS
ncbi:hypothetical protein BHE74_00035318 [Ensete ventricosum]|nr:hypothetical protein BHE74_00035318 [Ensete ventricosum]